MIFRSIVNDVRIKCLNPNCGHQQSPFSMIDFCLQVMGKSCATTKNDFQPRLLHLVFKNNSSKMFEKVWKYSERLLYVLICPRSALKCFKVFRKRSQRFRTYFKDVPKPVMGKHTASSFSESIIYGCCFYPTSMPVSFSCAILR